MKTLELSIRFESDCLFRWDIAPVGTINPRCGDYIYHNKRDVYNDDDFNIWVEKYKQIIKQFCSNVVENGYEDFIRDNLTMALKKDWSKDFTVENLGGDKNISVKFNIADREDRTPYTFYLTDEQIDDIDSLVYTIKGYEKMSDTQRQDALMNLLISTYYGREQDRFEERKYGVYEEQDLLDALDNLTDGSYDGAAYDTIEEFIKDYFRGYIA